MTKDKAASEMRDIWLCERKAHLPEHDGATGYFYYEPIRRSDLSTPPADIDVLKVTEVTEFEWFQFFREASFQSAQDIYNGKQDRGVDRTANNLGLFLKWKFPNGFKIIGDK